MKPICLLFVLPLLGTGCRTEQSAYLEKALSQLERIERVAYRRSSESYLPGDTIPRRYLRYYVEQRNRADTTLRHSYLSYYNADDTTRIDGGYDGTIAVDLDHDRREVVIDDFSIPRAPYRLTDMTFFCRAEAILRYVLTTSDPIRTEFTPCGDGYRLRLDIDRDCVVEFWGRPYYNRPPRELFPEAEHSAYEIVFDSERMPRKLRREQTHQITVDSVFDVRIDYEPQAPLRLEAYYPDGYMLRKRKLRNQAKKPYDIVGRQAPTGRSSTPIRRPYRSATCAAACCSSSSPASAAAPATPRSPSCARSKSVTPPPTSVWSQSKRGARRSARSASTCGATGSITRCWPERTKR